MLKCYLTIYFRAQGHFFGCFGGLRVRTVVRQPGHTCRKNVCGCDTSSVGAPERCNALGLEIISVIQFFKKHRAYTN